MNKMNLDAQVYDIKSRAGEDWPCWLYQRNRWVHTSAIQFKLEGNWEKDHGITHWSPDHDYPPFNHPL